MKAGTCFIILVAAAESVLCAAQPPGTSPAAVQASSAPVQVTSGALQISSTPVQITLAPPRAAPVASESNAATQNVLPGALPEDHGKLRGYVRVVAYGKEQYCRNDVATGSHVAKNPACLTYEQLLAEQARAKRFIEGVQDKPIIPTLSNGGAMR